MLFSYPRPQLVVISRPDFYNDESGQIVALMDSDSHFLLHLRKPEGTADDYRGLLHALPPHMLPRITLGDHFELADEFAVGGVHLSGRQPAYNGRRTLRVSKSCHTFDELHDCADYSYVFLSPIFNSISKQGYSSAFTHGQLLEASTQGIINQKVIALGGIDASTLPLLQPYAFGGAAVLGTVWEAFSVDRFVRLASMFK